MSHWEISTKSGSFTNHLMILHQLKSFSSEFLSSFQVPRPHKSDEGFWNTHMYWRRGAKFKPRQKGFENLEG